LKKDTHTLSVSSLRSCPPPRLPSVGQGPSKSDGGQAQLYYWNTGVMVRPSRPEIGTGSGGATYIYLNTFISISWKWKPYNLPPVNQVWARE